jgi:hypothetical protein
MERGPDAERQKGKIKKKEEENPTDIGSEPATFRLNQLRQRVPKQIFKLVENRH